MLLYSIKSDSEYKILPIRPSSIQLGCFCSFPSCQECEKPAAFVPHLFINDRGEYECTVIETNRIRQMLGLPPLEEWVCFFATKTRNKLKHEHIDHDTKGSKTNTR